MAHWPEYFQLTEAPGGEIMGYSKFQNVLIDRYSLKTVVLSVMGKAEGHGTNWHGHVTALSVAPDYRRLGLAAKLMSGLEEISEKYFQQLLQKKSS